MGGVGGVGGIESTGPGPGGERRRDNRVREGKRPGSGPPSTGTTCPPSHSLHPLSHGSLTLNPHPPPHTTTGCSLLLRPPSPSTHTLISPVCSPRSLVEYAWSGSGSHSESVQPVHAQSPPSHLSSSSWVGTTYLIPVSSLSVSMSMSVSVSVSGCRVRGGGVAGGECGGVEGGRVGGWMGREGKGWHCVSGESGLGWVGLGEWGGEREGGGHSHLLSRKLFLATPPYSPPPPTQGAGGQKLNWAGDQKICSIGPVGKEGCADTGEITGPGGIGSECECGCVH